MYNVLCQLIKDYELAKKELDKAIDVNNRENIQLYQGYTIALRSAIRLIETELGLIQ